MQIIDRNPTQGIARISAHFRTGIPSVRATLRVATSAYPEPPSQLTLDHDDNNVVLLLNRYSNYRKGREPLASMAYFCSTMLSERLPTGETRAKKLNVSRKLHTKIRKLSSRQGGPMGARKWDATAVDLNASEVTFLEQAVKLIIRRVAEVARDETQQLPPITLANLPKGAFALQSNQLQTSNPHHRGAAIRSTSRIPSLRARGDIPASASASEPSPPGTTCIAFEDYGTSSRLGLHEQH